ncbi:MAG: von Willebrand factor type A domain-containing protein [Prolixibacteraceae bacterium]|nr:von Willebrand factor type A domain-containing protein [Prolixibacteraceae bacterium]
MKRILIIFLLITGITIAANAQRVITGKVVDEMNAGIAGVLITDENKNASTKSGYGGFYRIELDSLAQKLIFSSPGLETQTLTIGKNKQINVTLHSKLIKDEVMMERSSGIMISGAKSINMAFSSVAAPFAGYGGDFNTEDYSAIHESGFRSVRLNPLSTFSIDVDNASYSNIRRFINMGQLPPADAVRIEEMINYFNYNYPEPEGEIPFSVSTEFNTCPWNEKHGLMLVALKAKSIEKENLPPSNLVFLLDVSGSMNAPNKLPLVKSAMKMLVNELRPQDKVAIVVYAGAAGVVLEATPGTNQKKIIDALENLNAGGSTAGGEGLQLAYKIAEENMVENGNNRIILATDGDFNVGPSSDAELEHMVEKNREKGVYLTVLGFGMGNYKDNKLETIADKGNGNYAYIDNIQEARKVFIGEFGATLFTLANDVKIQVEFNPEKVKGYRLVGYENRLLNEEDFKNDKKDAGEMGAGHTITALYEIIPAGSDEQVPEAEPLKYQERNKQEKSNFKNEIATVKIRYKTPGEQSSQLYTHTVDSGKNKTEMNSENFKLAAAVAQFGMLLRDSEYKGSSSFENTIGLARQAMGNDEEGYIAEMINLVKTAKTLMK